MQLFKFLPLLLRRHLIRFPMNALQIPAVAARGILINRMRAEQRRIAEPRGRLLDSRVDFTEILLQRP